MAIPSTLGYTLAKQGVNLSKKDPIYLRYPYNIIKGSDDYLKIDIVEYKAPGLSTQGNNQSFALSTSEDSLRENIQNPTATIILPIPKNISDSNSTDWQQDNMSSLTGAVSSALGGVIGSQDPFSGAMKAAGDFFNKTAGAATDGTGQKAIQSYFTGQAAGALLGQSAPDINSLIKRATGGVINQNVEMLFNGVQMRPAFTFSFDLVPRFKRESDEIKTIIRLLKQKMAAKKGSTSSAGGGFFIKSPDVFQIQYMSGSKPHPFLNRFKPTALTAMAVNYTGAGEYSTYSDATPVHMQLSLSFQELSPIYAEDYKDDVPGVGY